MMVGGLARRKIRRKADKRGRISLKRLSLVIVVMGVLGGGAASAETYGDPLGFVAVGTTPSDNPSANYLTLANGGTASSGTIAVSNGGSANGYLAVSNGGSANSTYDGLAISNGGTARYGKASIAHNGDAYAGCLIPFILGGCVMQGAAVSTTGNAYSYDGVAVSGTGAAQGKEGAVSLTGPATAKPPQNWTDVFGVAVSGTGSASSWSWLAVSGTGSASTTYQGSAVSGTGNASGQKAAISGLGSADGPVAISGINLSVCADNSALLCELPPDLPDASTLSDFELESWNSILLCAIACDDGNLEELRGVPYPTDAAMLPVASSVPPLPGTAFIQYSQSASGMPVIISPSLSSSSNRQQSDRIRVSDSKARPFQSVVHLTVRHEGGGRWEHPCTGVIINADSVLTAAHCLVPRGSAQSRGPATEIWITPGRDGLHGKPFGYCYSKGYYTPWSWRDYSRAANRNYDYGVIKIRSCRDINGKAVSKYLGNRVPALPLVSVPKECPAGLDNPCVTALMMGYPKPPINGHPIVTPEYGTGELYPGTTAALMRYWIRTYAGDSGAPLITNCQGGYCVSGVVSHRDPNSGLPQAVKVVKQMANNVYAWAYQDYRDGSR